MGSRENNRQDHKHKRHGTIRGLICHWSSDAVVELQQHRIDLLFEFFRVEQVCGGFALRRYLSP